MTVFDVVSALLAQYPPVLLFGLVYGALHSGLRTHLGLVAVHAKKKSTRESAQRVLVSTRWGLRAKS